MIHHLAPGTPNHRQRAQHALQPLDRKEFGLNRDDQTITGGQGIDHQHAEHGRTIEQNHVVGSAQWREGPSEHEPHALDARHQTIECGLRRGGGHEIEPFYGRGDHMPPTVR